MTDTHFTRSGSSPGNAFCSSGSSPTRSRSSSPAAPFIPEFQIQCSGSFCHGRNIHRGPGKFCPPCRRAKLRHNKTERSRPANVHRANRARRVLRYNKRMKYLATFAGFWAQLNRPRGFDAFRRMGGLTKQEFLVWLPASVRKAGDMIL